MNPLPKSTAGRLANETAADLTVRANRQLLAQAISNLVDNALKYGSPRMREGPDIQMTGAIEGDQMSSSPLPTVVLEFPPEDRGRVIERFVRLDESRSKPGNGLGLSLAAGVMKLHGGSWSRRQRPRPAREADPSPPRGRSLVSAHDGRFTVAGRSCRHPMMKTRPRAHGVTCAKPAPRRPHRPGKTAA